MVSNNNWVKNILKNRNITLIGFADLSEIDESLRHGFKYGISIAIPLKVFPSITAEPSIEYYNEVKRINTELKEVSDFLAEKIKEHGFNAYSLSKEKQNEDYRTPLPFKTLATRAGLGWIGKSAALITKEYGNAIRIHGVLTDMPIDTGTPVNSSLCGECMECAKKCPGNAVKGNDWNVNTDRNDLLDAFKCKNTVVKRGETLGVTEGTCGICLVVCPWTKKYISSLTEKIIFRKLTWNDIDKFIELRKIQLKEEGAKVTIDLTNPLFDFYQKHFKDGTFISWVATVNNEIIATSGMSFVEKPPYYSNPTGRIGILSSMYTIPEHRRKGIARKLLGLIVNEAKQSGCAVIHITASDIGVSLYQDFGFEKNDNFYQYKLI